MNSGGHLQVKVYSNYMLLLAIIANFHGLKLVNYIHNRNPQNTILSGKFFIFFYFNKT